MKLIARKPCRFNGENFYIGDEIPVDVVADPQTQEKLGVLTIANIENENPDAIYTQEDVDQKVQEAKKELEGQITEKEAKIKELEGTIEELRGQIAAAASISADKMAKVSATSATSAKKKNADKAGEA